MAMSFILVLTSSGKTPSFRRVISCNFCPGSFTHKRYIDDCFLLFCRSDHVQPFTDYLNHQHINIHFTCKVERAGKLFFLISTILTGKLSTSIVYVTASVTFFPVTRTSISSLKWLVNCSLNMGFPVTCLITVRDSSKRCSNQNHQSL